MKLRHLMGLFLAATMLAAVSTVWLAVELRDAMRRATAAEEHRFESIRLAEELRESSDNLTKFARMFVQTGNERYADFFQQILEIRNGELPLPNDYSSVFWDRVIVTNESLADLSSGEAVSFTERMTRLGFTDLEMELLSQALWRSDELALLEQRAFNAVRGIFQDGIGNYTRTGPPDLELAQRLLYSERYLETKAAIMEPIAAFERMVATRTTTVVEAARAEAGGYLVSIYVSIGALVFFLIVLTLVIHFRVLVRSRDLAEAATQITAGDLTARSGVRGRDELGVLGKTFDNMVSRLAETLQLVTAAKDRMQGELDIGHEIQMSMIPLIFPAFPDHPEFSVHAALKPAREVGGDFYDFYFIDERQFCICIGDVSGKGVPSALFMAVAKTLIKSRAKGEVSTAKILTQVNDELSDNNKECMFVTLFLAIIDSTSGDAVFTNAGHNPPYLRRADGSLKRLNARHGPIVGAVPDVIYGEDKVRLDPDSILLLYTDGVTEALDQEEQLFGEQRLADLLKRPIANSAEAAVEAVMTEVEVFEGQVEQADDLTVLAFEYIGARARGRQIRLIEIENDPADIAKVIDAFAVFARENGIEKTVAAKFNIVFDEVLSNIVAYAYGDDADHTISVDLEVDDDRLTITISDDGRPFDPLSIEEPDVTAELEEREIGGLGLHLVRNLVTDVTYERRDGRNVTTLTGRIA